MYTKLEDIKKGDKFILAGTISSNTFLFNHDVSFPVVADNDAKADEEGLVVITYDEGVRKFVAELKNQAQLQTLINTITPEKQAQEDIAEARELFLKSLKKSGGVHKSTAVIEILATTAPTLHKKGNRGEVIQIKWGAENLYPVFQFCTREKNSENGMLAGVPELLSRLKHQLSAVRKCHFFTRDVEIPETDTKISIVEALRRGATPKEMEYFRILADNFGTNHTM